MNTRIQLFELISLSSLPISHALHPSEPLQWLLGSVSILANHRSRQRAAIVLADGDGKGLCFESTSSNSVHFVLVFGRKQENISEIWFVSNRLNGSKFVCSKRLLIEEAKVCVHGYIHRWRLATKFRCCWCQLFLLTVWSSGSEEKKQITLFCQSCRRKLPIKSNYTWPGFFPSFSVIVVKVKRWRQNACSVSIWLFTWIWFRSPHQLKEQHFWRRLSGACLRQFLLVWRRATVKQSVTHSCPHSFTHRFTVILDWSPEQSQPNNQSVSQSFSVDALVDHCQYGNQFRSDTKGNFENKKSIFE